MVPAAVTFSSAAVNALPETCVATPAIHDGMLCFRTNDRLIAFPQGAKSAGLALSAEAKSAKEPPPLKMVQSDARLIGEWNGTLQVGAKLRLCIKIQEANETMTGTLISLDQGNATVEINRIGDDKPVPLIHKRAVPPEKVR